MWRPVQCFLLLSSNLEPSTGGIEVAPGMHKTFNDWTERLTDGGNNLNDTSQCIGQFAAVRSRNITNSINHVPVPCGSLFFWDEKLPHSTSLSHLGTSGRVCIYLGYLPYGPCNVAYKRWERVCWERGLVWVGGGQNWINRNGVRGSMGEEDEEEEERMRREKGFVKERARTEYVKGEGLGELGRKLMCIDEW